MRLDYLNLADFIPGVAPYETATRVDFVEVANGVRMTLTLAPMHDDTWTQRMAAGWESELDKLGRAVARLK